VISPRVAIAFAFAIGALLPLNALGLAIVFEAVWRMTDE